MIKKYQRLLNFMQVALDAGALLVAYVAAVLLKLHRGYLYDAGGVHYIRPFWMLLMLMTAYYSLGLYKPMRTRSFRSEVFMVTRAHLAGFLGIFAVLFIDPTRVYSREMCLSFVSFSFLCLVSQRFVVRRMLRHLRKRGYNQKHLLIIGAGEAGTDFIAKVRANRKFGYSVIGFLDDDTRPGSTVLGAPVLGRLALLPQILQRHSVDEVVLALPLEERHGFVVDICENAGVRLCLIPEYHQFFSCTASRVEEFDGIALLSVRRLLLR